MSERLLAGDPEEGGAFLVNEAVAHREIEGQVVLLLPDDYELYTLNGSGKLVWGELVGGRTADQIVARLAETYAIPLERARLDVAALLQELELRGVIRRA